MTNLTYPSTNRLTLQFHITGNCNLRCKHCYRTDVDTQPLSTEDVINIIDQYKALLIRYNSLMGSKKRGHINITGGEPFLRGDIKDILLYLGENKNLFSYGILSNGSFITEDLINILKKTDVSFIQLSIDGDKDTHDYLRAEGDFDRVLRTAEHLEKRGIKTQISFTANKDNYKFLPLVASECRKRKISKLWSDRLVPIGNGKELLDIAIDKGTMPDYIAYLNKAKGNLLQRILYPHTTVTTNRSLQFQCGGNIYSCSAGSTLITIDEFGNVMPCRRMPIICGNVLTEPLEEIYFESDALNRLRSCPIPEECRECQFALECRGGAKCQSYGLFGDFTKADPCCNIKSGDVKKAQTA